jgi:hypothetical protein
VSTRDPIAAEQHDLIGSCTVRFRNGYATTDNAVLRVRKGETVRDAARRDAAFWSKVTPYNPATVAEYDFGDVKVEVSL